MHLLYVLQLELPTDATFCTMSLFPFPRLFPTCFGLSWAHHQGYFQAVVFMLPFGNYMQDENLSLTL